MTILLLTLQAASTVPGDPPRPPPCGPATESGEVVVCAKLDQEQFRLRALPDRFERAKTGPGLELDLGKGAKANLYATGERSPDGKPDQRIMAKFRIPF